MAAREPLGVETRAWTAEAILDANGTASILLDGRGRVVYMSKPARILAAEGDGFGLCDGRIWPSDGGQRDVLQRLIAAASGEQNQEGAIALGRPSEKRSLLVLVSPFWGESEEIYGARVLLRVTDPEQVVMFPEAILRALYDLTTAEAEIANALLTGSSIEEIATLRKTSPATVRTQMKTLLGKTETRRQGELIRLLLCLPKSSPAVWGQGAVAWKGMVT